MGVTGNDSLNLRCSEDNSENKIKRSCTAYVSSSCESSAIIQEEVTLSLEVLQDLALTPEM